MTSTTTRIVAGLAALVTAVALSACSSKSTSNDAKTSQEDKPLISAAPAGHNVDDIAFATNMIPHHQQAVDMAALVPTRSTNAQVIKLASDISAEQGPEIQTLKVFLVQWKEDPDSDTGHSGHDNMPMTGMVDDATMAKLQSLQGAEFDTLWLQSMIGHHQGAIEMAKAEVANGANSDAIDLAKSIVTTQQAEIDQMKQMQGG